ncbi:MAG: LamG domain-containing protein [Phycisphaerae bacterium]|nr:LamG domain-containing protein [Phycisphaerae bacterium]
MCRKLTYSLSFVLMFGLVLTSVVGAADPDLVGWWPLNEGSGDTVFDLSASGNNGTVNNAGGGLGAGGAVWVNDPERGMVASFNGNNSSGAYISTDLIIPFMDLNNDFTWALWVKQEGDGTGVNEVILGNRYGGTPTPGSGQFIKFTSTRFEYYHGGHNGTIDYDDPTPGEWVHMVVVKDGATLTHYRNGEFSATGTTTATIDENPFGMGGDATNATEMWSGYLSDVRLYTKALTAAEVLGAMQGSGEAWPYASAPNPADGALHGATWVNVSWRPGGYAVSHDVYLGDSFDEVTDADSASPVFQGNQGGTFIIAGFVGFPYPDGLVPGTTYYWRIDEVNDSEPNSPWKGDVWSFSIPPKTAYNPDPADGAEFVDPNAILSWAGGYGARLHTVYLGDNYDDVSNATAGTPSSAASYDPGTLEREKVLYWRVDESDGIETQKGDIWAFTTPGAVGNPQPANGAVDVQTNETLSWTAADNAASHELYFGADADAVMNATTASPEYIGPRALGAVSYDPGGLDWEGSHAWRVDEVYPTGTVKGLVWTFTIADFIGVDDFESYNDIDPPDAASNRIFDKWIDGFGTTTNGALVGNDLPPYAEQTIVHGGSQSMPYLYDNNLKTSEATLTLVYPRDWTAEGVTKLSLWFRGGSTNSAERMFIALNGNSVVYHDDASATQIAGWTEWVIDLQAFAGVNLANVNTITIGFGTKGSPAAGGSGEVYFDDIRLIR